MSLNNSSSVVGCESAQFDSISLTIASCSSIITLSSSSTADSPLAVYEFTTERITCLLKNDSSNYKITKNTKNNLSSMCWQNFSFPTKKCHLKEEFEPIPGSVSCRACFQKYPFISSFGTRILNSHIVLF